MKGYKENIEKQCLEIFKRYDKNKNNVITFDELESIWK